MEDQLRASEGWVRCGHCRQIFDALERLFQLEDQPVVTAPDAVPGATTQSSGPPQTQPPVQHHAEPQEADVGWAETRPALFGEEHLLVSGAAPQEAAAPVAEVIAATSPDAFSVAELTDPETVAPAQPDTSSSPSVAASEAAEVPQVVSAELTFLSSVPASAQATDATDTRGDDTGPTTQPLPLPFVDTAASTEVGASGSPGEGPVEHADSATLFLIEDVGADTETGRAKELIQELEPSSVIQQRQAQKGGDYDRETTAQSDSASAGSARNTSAGDLSSSRSGGGRDGAAGSGGRRRSSAGSRRSSATTPVVDDEFSVPAFVRRADSKARWQRPWVRTSLAIAALGGAVALSAQAALQWHDLIGARYPALRPMVQDLCHATTGCVLKPPRLIDAVIVESSALTRPPDLNGYRLNVLIHNRLEHEIAAPHLELTLTDISGAVLARRVLAPVDFGLSGSALEAQSESAWQLDFRYDTLAISGYTVRAFYP